MKRHQLFLLAMAIGILVLTACQGENQMERQFQDFLVQKVADIGPVEKAQNMAYWEASISGKTEDFEKYSELNLKYKQLFADKDEFSLLKKYGDSGKIQKPELQRQLELLYNLYVPNQIDSTLMREITALEGSVENKFSAYRGQIDGETITNNEILEILKKETTSAPRQKAWEASKMVGAEVGADLIELVKLRNKAAEALGYENYYLMSLELAEQDDAELVQIFAKLADLTYEPFRRMKTEMDAVLAENCQTIPAMLRPWHYHDPFFQEAPMVARIDLDTYYADKDVRELAETYYSGIGLPADDILARSDLYEKEGKNPHAYCTHIDREGDVRVLMNLKNDVSWMETSLHELGHGVYDKYLDPNMPYLLREPAHIFCTEAIAMFFGRMARNPYWMQVMLNLSDEKTAEISAEVQSALRRQQLVFARWVQVMFHFERALYSNPDQNLNVLWWDLVEKYQMVSRPANRNQPDWAAKIHFTIAPVYYHNYMLGELMASQISATVVEMFYQKQVGETVSYANDPKLGEFLKKNIFEPGASLNWNQLLQFATGEGLNPSHFVRQFVE
ncbi:M2 family metallopeptidase [bacterium]|nr:M2 family metallopeptidase [bacterium]